MVEIADIFRIHGSEYREKYGDRMPPSHLEVMDAIEQCRTEALGGHVYLCLQCEEPLYSYHSCKNRHCPKCQNDHAQDWLERQKDLLLPVPYFMVTFTLPDELRPIARSNQVILYNILFRSAAAALQKLALDPRFVGGKIGMVGVLHTWTRDMAYHPHVHFLVPAGGISSDANSWLPSREDFLVHVVPLSIIFRAKFRDELKKTPLLHLVPKQVWQKDWVVHSEPVGSGLEAFKYLAPYIFRVAITNNRILKLDNGWVTFEYKESATGQTKVCTITAEEFIRRFLQHVLPNRFVKVRYYGFFAPGNRPILAKVKEFVATCPNDHHNVRSCSHNKKEPFCCRRCGSIMILIDKIRPRSRWPP